jgi:hypothetical protein
MNSDSPVGRKMNRPRHMSFQRRQMECTEIWNLYLSS